MKLSTMLRMSICSSVVIVSIALSGCDRVTTLVKQVVTSATPVPSITPSVTPTPQPTATSIPTPTPTPLTTPMALAVSVVAEDDINLRQDPNNQSLIVGQLAPGVFVPVHEISDDGLWIRVGLDTVGWVNTNLVSLNGMLLFGEDTASERQPLLQADSPVNVRSGPGTKFRVIGRLKAGQILDVLETSEDANWVKIPFGNGEGWVNTGTVIIAGGKPTVTPVVTEEVTREP